jgi:redox-sensitive bicupin YhaK (pirin superfamily)
VLKEFKGVPSMDGAGVKLLRVFAHDDVTDLDPFLLLDFFDSNNPDDYHKGFPWHPHRGIETITYLVDGLLEHGDSLGNKGVIEPSGCQWMTAGSGIIHQEMPQPAKRMLGAQLWLNLPEAQKMTNPAYRDINAKDLVIVSETNRIVKIIAGDYQGKNGPVKGTYVEPFYLDVSLPPSGEFEYPLPENCTAFFLMLEGAICFPDGKITNVENARAILLSQGDLVKVSSAEGARFLLIGGMPLHEPVAWGGPIVMNTRAELTLAFDELDRGIFIKHK